ncbi:hypothetical protein J2T02_002056 [Chitinophaga terrae (ex Kim and Jung 2007)]|nr:hypothetical protein [Chitinophaga terrae (ex Kim and Jung 2007)]
MIEGIAVKQQCEFKKNVENVEWIRDNLRTDNCPGQVDKKISVLDNGIYKSQTVELKINTFWYFSNLFERNEIINFLKK